MSIRMDKPAATGPEGDFLVLSDLPPGQVERRLAVIFSLGIVAVFFIIIGLSDNHPHPIPGFVLTFSTAMFVCDTITAILLFAQFSILRSPALLVIANGYVFTALILIPYTLSFPGVVGPESLMGGLQSPAGLYVVWHSGFPAFVIGYALSKDADPRKPSSRIIGRGTARAAIALSIALTAVLVAAAAIVCIANEPLLPRIMLDRLSFSSLYPSVVGGPDVSLSICALIVLWIRRRSTLDLWLMVVMFLYAIDMPLSYYPAPIRFSDGWYAVRAIAFLASSIVLVVLLYEITTLYGRLFRAIHAQRHEREVRLMTGDAIAAAIAHEVKQPLSSIVVNAGGGLRWLDRATPDLDRAKTILRRIVDDGLRASAIIESIRASFKKDAGQRVLLDVNDLIGDVLALAAGDLERHRILVEVEMDPRVPQVSGDRIQLQQVLLNLVTNAIHSMAAKEGTRLLRVKSEVDDEGVVVSVADTGKGIDSDVVERIFEPLFTTKSDGMGMGLSICRSIIESHEGRLWFDPNRPEGANFRFKLLADGTTSADAPRGNQIQQM
jgi:signal transduction histidine kinase